MFCIDDLGNIIDHHLNFRDNFEKSYKKASSRLLLLGRMRCYLTSKAAPLVYTMMILSLFTSSCSLKSPYNNTQKLEYNSLDRRAGKIIKFANRERVLLLKSCLCKESNEEFNNYFKFFGYKYKTTNNSKSIKLPPVKLDLTKQGFYFSGGV